ncbi:hypothetical protein [Kitasatospora sp. KL5]|uniref:hypothetical protein n=1 Tax=Kitasatospora sp. KL5 TaxID=3425125 RepID=UPI003D6F78A6
MAAAATVPARRGRLRIADRVYAGLARQAVREALAEIWAERGLRGAAPKARVLVVGGKARITLHLEFPYPADLAALSHTCRDAVAVQIARLTGTPVSEVALQVEKLVTGGAQ